MLRSRIVASSSTKKRYAVLEICSSSFASSSSSSSPVLLKHSQNSPTRANDGEQQQQRGNDDDANPSPPEQKKKKNNNNNERRRKRAITIRRAIEIKSEDDAVAIENTTSFALERVQNVLLDARATTAIGDVLFGIITAEQKRSPSLDDAKEEEEKTKTLTTTFTTRRSLFLNACREEREEGKDEDKEDDGRGLAFLLRRKNFATGNEYWTIVAKARRDLSLSLIHI